MEDKMFELMTKLYSEFSEFRKDMNEFRKETKDDISVLKNDVVKLENKLDSALDGYKVTFEKLTVLEKKVDDISTKVEKQDVEITVIKGGKRTKAE
ncbi:MAG: hypothetical protein ACM3TR_11630 [Caulobacteraceae bacterium]